MLRTVKRPNGFTLIELMVVMAIISLLSSVVLASLNTAKMNARNVKVRAEVKQIINALFLAREDSATGKFPGLSGQWQCLKPSGSCWNNSYNGNTTIVNALTPYIPNIPKPPTKTGNYMYDAYLYLPNHTGNVGTSPPGTYIIWAKEGSPITDCQGYNAGLYQVNASDPGLYYCYQLIAPL